MSLDAASILASVPTGLLPATAPSSSGDESGGSDFAALLESLAGVLQASRSPAEGEAAALNPAAAGAGAGIEATAALGLELPALPGASTGQAPARLVAALSFRMGGEDPAAEAAPLAREADEPGLEPAALASTASIPAALQALLAPSAVAPAVEPQSGARQSDAEAASLDARATAGQTSETAEAGDDPAARTPGVVPDPASRTAGSPGGSATPPAAATAAALALGPGVLAVTGRIIAAESRPETPAPDAGTDAEAGAADPAAAARRIALTGEASELSALEARPADSRPPAARGTEARRRDAAASATPPAAQAAQGVAGPLNPFPTPGTQASVAPAAASSLQGRANDAAQDATPDDRGEPAALDPAGDPAPFAQAPAAVDLRAAAAPGAPPPPPKANAETVVALAAQMARKLDDGITRFDLELNPGDLGRVDVRLEIDASGAVRAAFTFEDAHAAGELGRRADELQKSLESAGFNLSGGLSFDVSGDRSQGRSQAWADAREGRAQSPQPPAPEPAREGLADITAALTGRRAPARSGVDIRI